MPFSSLDVTLARLLVQYKAVDTDGLASLMKMHGSGQVPLPPLLVAAGLITEAALQPYVAMLAAKGAGAASNPSSARMPSVPAPPAPLAPPAPPAAPAPRGGAVVPPARVPTKAAAGKASLAVLPPAAFGTPITEVEVVDPASLVPPPRAKTGALPAVPPPAAFGNPTTVQSKAGVGAPIARAAPGAVTHPPRAAVPPAVQPPAVAPAVNNPPAQAPAREAKGAFKILAGVSVEKTAALEQAQPLPEVDRPRRAQPVVAPFPAGEGSTREEMELILRTAADMLASDLHLHSGMPVMVRLHGALTTQRVAPYSAGKILGLVSTLLSKEQQQRWGEAGELDFACSVPGAGRFRANLYKHQRGVDATFRIIPERVPSLAELGLPESLMALTRYHNGMLLFTGPAGCGKSTTMAAVLGAINARQDGHILTIEDPIEFVHRGIRSSVNQRQVGPHTTSFARALKGALREDPDVIVIGELRDLESISLAMTAAETGHLVLGTLHTSSAVSTVNRIINAYPPAQQDQTRAMLSESLRGVVSQRLVRVTDGSRRVAALEVMVCNRAVGNLIRENKTQQIRSILQTSSAEGMYLLDNNLAALVQTGVIDREEALLFAEEPKRFGG